MTSKIILLAQLFTVLMFVLLSSCSKESATSDQYDSQRILLENSGKSWVLTNGSVTKDGFDVNSQFSGFQLNFSGNTFVTKSSLTGVWPTQGTWSFHQENVNVLERSDGVLMSISITSSQLRISFTDPNGSGGRVEGIPGEYTFELQSE